jgi:hypothetical protein
VTTPLNQRAPPAAPARRTPARRPEQRLGLDAGLQPKAFDLEGAALGERLAPAQALHDQRLRRRVALVQPQREQAGVVRVGAQDGREGGG